MIESSRVQSLNDRPVKGDQRYVLYWMQASQRTVLNHALEYAVTQANGLGLPVVVCFGLMDDYPEANERHYAFLLQGLAEVNTSLAARGIGLAVKHGPPTRVAIHYARQAALVVMDRGYARHQIAWREEVAEHVKCLAVQVESDVVVPVEVASDHHEYAARTLRPKVQRVWDEYLKPLRAVRVERRSDHKMLLADLGDIDVSDWQRALGRLKLDRTVHAVDGFIGGHSQAKKRLTRFTRSLLHDYKQKRNNPLLDAHSSTLSPYLHFGQISPIEAALAVLHSKHGSAADRESYVEELIVRRELSMNFCNFCDNYDRYDALPDWAQKTLEKHAKDERPVTYSLAQLEAAKTHDRWWNAAMLQMSKTGFMHNYMRMYWGKKILEWSSSPRRAFEITLYLNNRYFLDGRDPNSFANVAWIYGLHDRPWGPERKIFGLVRYMNAAGLERKFDMEAYARSIESLP